MVTIPERVLSVALGVTLGILWTFRRPILRTVADVLS